MDYQNFSTMISWPMKNAPQPPLVHPCFVEDAFHFFNEASWVKAQVLAEDIQDLLVLLRDGVRRVRAYQDIGQVPKAIGMTA